MKESGVAMAETGATDLVAFNQCQDLLRPRLTKPLLRLIPQLTGLRLHVLWHRPLGFQVPGAAPVLCPMARRRTVARARWLKCCESCLEHRWKTTSSPASRGRRFIGPCGLTNFCACLQVDEVCPLTLVLQARIALRSPSAHNGGQGVNAQSQAALTTDVAAVPPHAKKLVSHAAFDHAVDLTRLILHDLESTARVPVARNGLKDALHESNNDAIENTCPIGELHYPLSALSNSVGQPGLSSHAQKPIEAMIAYVRQHYHRPIGLNDMASALRMNASYLSDLFHQTTGVPFHRYLEEVRLSRAKELLRDPRNRVCEVACAVGYASPDAFRHAFKTHERLSPEAWRSGQ